MDDAEFEALVTRMCLTWLGQGVSPFSAGPDGGRDAKFNGKANSFPSAQTPLTGKVVIQAKHTANPIGKCADSDFSTLLKKEEKSIKRLATDGLLEHYMLFTNRSVAGKVDEKIIKQIEKLHKNIQSAHLIGREKIHLRIDGDTKILAGLIDYRSELRFQPDDLVEEIHAFHAAVGQSAQPGSQVKSQYDFTYVKKKNKKNKVNGLTEDAYQSLLMNSLSYFTPIQDFLKNPRNTDLAGLYHDAANELRQKILVNFDSYDTFDQILVFLYDHIVAQSATLRAKKRYVTTFLHYMYYDCDIGKLC